jgi:hypothetical protein
LVRSYIDKQRFKEYKQNFSIYLYKMSGARALASARRRRAAPDMNQPTNSRTSSAPTPVPTRSSSPEKQNNPIKNGQKINPGVMLLNHDKVLKNLNSVVENLNQKVEEQQLSIEGRMNDMVLDDSSIEFFKEKVINLESQLNDIKKHILKVQSFAMETNLQFMQMKNVSQNENSQIMEEADQISDHLLNTNSSIVNEKLNNEDLDSNNTTEIDFEKN